MNVCVCVCLMWQFFSLFDVPVTRHRYTALTPLLSRQYEILLQIQRVWVSQALTGETPIQQALTSMAAAQDAVMIAVYPCGPVCITPPTPLPGSSSGLSLSWTLIIAFVCGIVFIIILSALIIILIRCVREMKHHTTQHTIHATKHAMTCIASITYATPLLLIIRRRKNRYDFPKPDQWTIPRSSVTPIRRVSMHEWSISRTGGQCTED